MDHRLFKTWNRGCRSVQPLVLRCLATWQVSAICHVASFPGLPCFYLLFVYTIVCWSGRPSKKRERPGSIHHMNNVRVDIMWMYLGGRGPNWRIQIYIACTWRRNIDLNVDDNCKYLDTAWKSDFLYYCIGQNLQGRKSQRLRLPPKASPPKVAPLQKGSHLGHPEGKDNKRPNLPRQGHELPLQRTTAECPT